MSGVPSGISEAADVTAGAGLSPGDKAAVLVESLPYIRRFWGQVEIGRAHL